MTDTPPNGDPWYTPGLTFKCTQCGNCCSGPSGYVWFNSDEARQIADHLGLSEAEFRRRFARRVWGRWTLDEIKRDKGQYDCVFLRRDSAGKALCSIYPVRPTQCRTWPFWPENIASKEAWDYAARTTPCPGMQRRDGDFVPVERVRVLANTSSDE
ncbi:MAG: YkgJ family cysteine cluster protein [Phycisphaeraceae bacterium]